MKLLVNVDKVHTSYSQMIAEKLEENHLPSCFGQMVLPLLKNSELFEEEGILINSRTIPKELAVETDLKELIAGSEVVIEGKALTKEGFVSIVEFKERKVEEYVQQCLKCTSCTFTDLCYKLTKNTFKSVQILTGGN